MLEYLESKYGEQFELVDVSDVDYLPPGFQRSDALIVHSDGVMSEYFSVMPDEEDASTLTDSGVLAIWAHTYSKSYESTIQSAFGEDARAVVQLDCPDAWGLGPAQLDRDPSAYFAETGAPYSFTLHVLVPVSTTDFQPDDYYPAIAQAYALTSEVYSAGGFAQLVVYFYHASENVDDYVRLSTMPAANVSWRSMPGIAGAVVAGPGTPMTTVDDITSAYHRADE